MRDRLEPVESAEVLALPDLALETIMLGLRTDRGIDLAAFERRFGFDLVERDQALVERSVAGGLLRHEAGRLLPTLEGMAVADALAASFEL